MQRQQSRAVQGQDPQGCWTKLGSEAGEKGRRDEGIEVENQRKAGRSDSKGEMRRGEKGLVQKSRL